MDNSFAFRSSTYGRHVYFVLLHTTEKPDESTWEQYVNAMAMAISQSSQALHVFVVTDGGGPDSSQRRALAAVFATAPRESMTYVFTTSIVTRGIVTAFCWMARSRAVAHSPEAFSTVCEECQLSARAVLENLQAVQKELQFVRLLGQLDRLVERP